MNIKILVFGTPELNKNYLNAIVNNVISFLLGVISISFSTSPSKIERVIGYILLGCAFLLFIKLSMPFFKENWRLANEN